MQSIPSPSVHSSSSIPSVVTTKGTPTVKDTPLVSEPQVQESFGSTKAFQPGLNRFAPGYSL